MKSKGKLSNFGRPPDDDLRARIPREISYADALTTKALVPTSLWPPFPPLVRSSPIPLFLLEGASARNRNDEEM
jgi:hypothetical protein